MSRKNSSWSLISWFISSMYLPVSFLWWCGHFPDTLGFMQKKITQIRYWAVMKKSLFHSDSSSEWFDNALWFCLIREDRSLQKCYCPSHLFPFRGKRSQCTPLPSIAKRRLYVSSTSNSCFYSKKDLGTGVSFWRRSKIAHVPVQHIALRQWSSSFLMLPNSFLCRADPQP